MSADLAKEALRQQMLLRALWRDARPGVVAGWMRDGLRFERGLAAYQANASALAERALAAAFPTVQQLVGDAAFALLARAFWRRHPPLRGDVGEWGDVLPAFIADDEQLADEVYLADVARLDWAVHAAERAADTPALAGLERLAGGDPAALRLVLAPGAAVLPSAHPVVTIWQAHRSTAPDRFVPVRAAFEAQTGETAFVTRRGWRAEVHLLDTAAGRFTAALLNHNSLAAALDAGGAEFDLQAWLVAALQSGWLAGVEEV